MIDYHIMDKPEAPPLYLGLYRYLMAANGVFIEANRKGLGIQARLIGNGSKLVGLHPLENTMRLDNGRVDRETVRHILLRCYFELPNEVLFYLTPRQGAWSLRIPEQIQSPGGVRPVDPFNLMARDALIEVHSHNSMPAYFSGTDDHDETGFRIYAVIGKVDSHRPEIRVRVGVYGNFISIPAHLVFDLGGTHLRDAAERI